MSSYLFTPANVSKNLIKGLNSDTFAMIPDLEDSVPLEIKSNALNNLIDFSYNEEKINNIINSTSFEVMKKKETEEGFHESVMDNTNENKVNFYEVIKPCRELRNFKT